MAGTGLPTGGKGRPVLLQPSPEVRPTAALAAADSWGQTAASANQAMNTFAALAAQEQEQKKLKWSADFELAARAKRIELQGQNPDNPEAAKKDWAAYSEGVLSGVPLAYADHARRTLGMEGMSWLGEAQRAGLAKTKALAADSVKARMEASATDVLGYAYRGEMGDERYVQGLADYRAYLNDGVRAGLWSQDHADLKADELAGKAKAEGIVGRARAMFSERGPEGAYAEGEALLNNPGLRLTPAEVESYRGRLGAEINKWSGFQSADRQKLAVEADILKDKFKVGAATSDEVTGMVQRATALRDYRTASELTRGYARQETLAGEAWKPVTATAQTIRALQDKARSTPADTLPIAPGDREALTRIALAEAGNQGADGLAGVIYTVLNRTRHPGWGGNVDSVINAKNQFEPVGRAGGDWRNLPAGSEQQRAAVGQLIDEIAAGKRPDPTGGATYFLNRRISAERGTDFGAGKEQFLAATIGDHTFYRPGVFGEAATPVPGYTVRPGVDPDLIRDMEAANTKKMEALKSDPLGYVSSLRGAPALPTVDWSRPDAAAAALQERQRTAAATSSMFKIEAAPVLTKPELDQMKAVWDGGDSGTRAQIVGTLGRGLDGKHLEATMEKVAGNNPVFAAAAMAYQKVGPDLALSLVRGASYIDRGAKILPPDSKFLSDVNDYLGTAYADHPQTRAAIIEAAKARYADLSAKPDKDGKVDFSGVYDSDRMRRALVDVSGGVVKWSGSSAFVRNREIIPPKPYMSSDDFGKLAATLTDADFAGAETAGRKPFKASDFHKLAWLESIGPGQYTVWMNDGSVKRADGSGFILDLNGREVPQMSRGYTPAQGIPAAYATGGAAATYR